ncbi:MAG: hypothetical protein M3R68_04540 [Acidobacteriota bacterium]|nr:hypothetical protein [Acidobacteriota bacterium]
MHLNKCHKCGLVNGQEDHACRRCGGMLRMGVGSLGESLAPAPEKAPRYLFLMPFLILALGFTYWSSQMKKSAVAASQVETVHWLAPAMNQKAGPSVPPLEAPRAYRFEGKLPPIVTVRPNPNLFPYQPPHSQPTPTPDQPTFSSAR